MQRLCPYYVIVLLRERRASDFPVVSPQLAFGGNDIFPEKVNALVDMGRLWEVIPAGRDLRYSFCVCHQTQVLSRRHNYEDVAVALLERVM